jgi:hypothetical protein
VRVSGLGMGLVGLFITSSFGGIVMVIVGVAAYLLVTRPRGWWVILALIFVPALLYIGHNANSAEISPELTTERFDRSSGTRSVIWSGSVRAWRADPLGIGPDGTQPKNVSGTYEPVHSDWLGFLTERGPLGLIALIGIWATIWHFAPPRGMTRVMLCSIMAAGFFRETFNYRHMWFFLALALAFETQQISRQASSPAKTPVPKDSSDID